MAVCNYAAQYPGTGGSEVANEVKDDLDVRPRKRAARERADCPGQESAFWVHEEFFDRFADPIDTNVIGPEGVLQLCQYLNIEPNNILMLVLAWRFGCQTMGYISREEWMSGMQRMGVEAPERLIPTLQQAAEALRDMPTFRELYRFAFGFMRPCGRKNVNVAVAAAMWEVLLGRQYCHAQAFTRFLSVQTGYRVINSDQWANFLEFATVVDRDFANYDGDGAWPVLFDEFVDWMAKEYGIGPRALHPVPRPREVAAPAHPADLRVQRLQATGSAPGSPVRKGGMGSPRPLGSPLTTKAGATVVATVAATAVVATVAAVRTPLREQQLARAELETPLESMQFG